MLNDLNALLEEQIKDLYSAENQLVKALPKMVKAATSPALKKAFERHLEETKEHVERLVKVASLLETKPGGKKCKGMEGLIEEGKEVMEEEGDEMALDAALIAAAQKVEHYEISGYGTARELAARLDNSAVMRLLEATLAEEKTADDKLTKISTGEVLPALATRAEEEAANESSSENANRGGHTRTTAKSKSDLPRS